MAEGSVSGSHAMPGVRQVTELEADYVTELFTLAFQDDPTWGGLPRRRETPRAPSSLVGAIHAQRSAVRMGLDDRRRRRGLAVDPAGEA